MSSWFQNYDYIEYEPNNNLSWFDVEFEFFILEYIFTENTDIVNIQENDSKLTF